MYKKSVSISVDNRWINLQKGMLILRSTLRQLYNCSKKKLKHYKDKNINVSTVVV